MTSRRSFRRAPFWKRSEGPTASFIREGDRVRVDFEYTPSRVKVVKAVSGARYHPDDKSWSVPLSSVDAILTHGEFPSFRTLNGLGDRTVAAQPFEEAGQSLRKSPFRVSEEVLAGAAPEVVLRMNQERRRIRVIPRLGSQALKVLKRFKGAMYSGSDAAFSVPTELIADLLKRYRDKGVVFGVEASAGTELANSAALRADVLANPERYGAEELNNALLTPFIMEVGELDEVAYRPCYFTTEQFKVAFPGSSRRGAKPFMLDERGLLSFIARRDALPFPVWLTSGVWKSVAEHRRRLQEQAHNTTGPIDDTAADVIELPVVWRTAPTGRGALSVSAPKDSDLRVLLLGRVGELLTTTYPSEAGTVTAEIPDSRLLEVFGEISHLFETQDLGIIPRSSSFERLLEDLRKRAALRERGAYYGGLTDVAPTAVGGLTTEEAARLFPHQRVAVEWLREFPSGFLGDDMGLGKTLSVLSYYAALKRTESFEKLMVVCPNSLTRNWVREAAQWFPELKAIVLSGNKGEKAWTLRLLSEGSMDADIVVVNYEGVRLSYVTPELEAIVKRSRTLLCIDESQRVKNHAGKTFKALATIAPHCKRRVLLSGTPTPKDVTDLWAQMRILDGGARFGKSFYKWLGTVAELGTEYSEFAVKRFNEFEVQEAVYRAQEIMLRRRKERVVNLPPKTFSLREIELTGSQRERYDEIREGLILRMRSLSGEQFVREITNILEEYLRAVQIASNPRLIDPQWKGEPAKFLELDEIVNEVVREQGQKIVVWTNYLGNIRELVERYKDLGAAPFSGEVSAAERERTVRAFQNEDSPRVLVAVPAAGGVGITLTAAQTAVYLDKTWNAEHWMQSVDRIHRIGQTGTVNIISLLGCKVDEIIHWNLRRKEQGQAEVLGDYGTSELSSHGLPRRKELMEALEIE
jgi:SWI/SNF-related matrix-associated actin-dependent regulator 1 of chromatin subfamily A